MSDRRTFLQALGPGIVFAAAAVGVSHIVQSTRAGAVYGLALIGVVIGVLAALSLNRLLGNFLFEVSATDPATYVGVSVMLLGVALLAAWLPARRATAVDPATVLRYDT